jgi:hypothetical protein
MNTNQRVDRELPVPWSTLKEVQDLEGRRRVSFGPVLGVILAGVSLVSFGMTFLAAVDPSESVEPVSSLVIAGVTFGLMTGVFSFLLLSGAAPGSGASG